MRRLFAVLLSAFLLFGVAPAARADIGGLTPCADNARFQSRAATAQTAQAKARFEMYSQALCGTDGLPHLIVDGRWNHAGDFMIPGIAFLYITGTIGWAGRSYLQAVRGRKDATMAEIQIDLPLALKSTLGAATWPLAAFRELTTGKLTEADSKITVSPPLSAGPVLALQLPCSSSVTPAPDVMKKFLTTAPVFAAIWFTLTAGIMIEFNRFFPDLLFHPM